MSPNPTADGGAYAPRRIALGALSALALLLASSPIVGCGATTEIDPVLDIGSDRRQPSDEVCDGLDQDLDGAVDEDFRDEVGRYARDAQHCGGCGRECLVPDPFTLTLECVVLEESPVCAATECVPGYGPSRTGACVPLYTFLCLPCLTDDDCGDSLASRCEAVAGEGRCVVDCAAGCPDGYECLGASPEPPPPPDDVDGGIPDDAGMIGDGGPGDDDDGGVAPDGGVSRGSCVPVGGSCRCEPGQIFELACDAGPGMPMDPDDPTDPEEGLRCPGRALCDQGELSACVVPEEACNLRDDDCDGEVDEAFKNEFGAYADLHHCGECGVDCADSPVPEGDLVCGGDPFAPTCVLSCPDARDGIQPGDRIDGDRDIATGCECTVGALIDVPGPVGAQGEALDLNCDGADGMVPRSVYVATDGDDEGPGSPTRPLRTLTAAMERALEEDRKDVFVASGDYVEALEVPAGVRVHGGYRRDFLALDPAGFATVIRSPRDSPLPGGAAVSLSSCDGAAGETALAWLQIVGRDAAEPSEGSIALYIGCAESREIRIEACEIRAGIPGRGMDGDAGEPGEPPAREPDAGEPPRGAVESNGICEPIDANEVAGGSGGAHSCSGRSTAGGVGGSPGCPVFANFQPGGSVGRGTSPGAGGNGGQDSNGPVVGSSCSEVVCCGLADFVVPSFFTGPSPGEAGGDGDAGSPGRGCADAFGVWRDGRFVAATATSGTSATAGSGGGGGGAGGGAEMDIFPGLCEFPDGLGGGGGGGGAGGCGGTGGDAGTSGAPAIGIFVDGASAPNLTISGCFIRTPDGGRGGDGGAGGGGAAGSPGAPGGSVPLSERTTPTLAGPFPGERGGAGGRGGDGGGGGGGCGGYSAGVRGGGDVDAARWSSANLFDVGRGGRAGRGGGGAAAGGDGAEGGSFDVLSR